MGEATNAEKETPEVVIDGVRYAPVREPKRTHGGWNNPFKKEPNGWAYGGHRLTLWIGHEEAEWDLRDENLREVSERLIAAGMCLQYLAGARVQNESPAPRPTGSFGGSGA